LLDNWQEEAEKHLGAGALGQVLQARGSSLKEFRRTTGSEQEGGLPVLDVAGIQRFDWVLTTYETWRDYQLSFNRVSWAVATFDEVQKVKNPAAALTDAAKATKAEFVLALTGTPVENRLADLWCIIDLVQPGRLGPLKEFSRKYEVETPDEGTPEVLQPLREFLQERAPAIMKRRLKEHHLEGLPEKKELFPVREMPSVQAIAYADRVGRARMAAGNRGSMLETLGSLRSISLHPGRSGQESDEEFIACSARLVETFGILDRIAAEDQKALVFIESREMQGLLAEIFQRRYDLPGPPLIINGAVSGQKRHERVNEFQRRRGSDVMILSPKAGGVGLTLTAANNVIHLSRWWNPAVEDQCTDRVYRIGQDREVTVYHPIATHPEFGDASFDVRLDELLRRKRRLSREVLAPPAATNDDFSRLFNESVNLAGSASPAGLDSSRALDLKAIDIMEPEAFENWVLDQLRELGFTVRTTPRSGDGGADGIALAPAGSTGPNLLIQCKHTQRSGSIGKDAIEEVLRSQQAYEVPDPLGFLVISNAAGYSVAARQFADESGVTLIHRDLLGRLDEVLKI
jgi:SNF2 family DNA or RNA helicase